MKTNMKIIRKHFRKHGQPKYLTENLFSVKHYQVRHVLLQRQQEYVDLLVVRWSWFFPPPFLCWFCAGACWISDMDPAGCVSHSRGSIWHTDRTFFTEYLKLLPAAPQPCFPVHSYKMALGRRLLFIRGTWTAHRSWVCRGMSSMLVMLALCSAFTLVMKSHQQIINDDAEVVLMEALQEAHMSAYMDPRLSAIHNGWNNNRFVYIEFGLYP